MGPGVMVQFLVEPERMAFFVSELVTEFLCISFASWLLHPPFGMLGESAGRLRPIESALGKAPGCPA